MCCTEETNTTLKALEGLKEQKEEKDVNQTRKWPVTLTTELWSQGCCCWNLPSCCLLTSHQCLPLHVTGNQLARESEE